MQRIRSNKPDSVFITWNLTSTCNFACSYCLPNLHDGKYGFPDYTDALHFIKQVAETANDITLELVGGEPTLWPKLIEFLQEIKKYSNITVMIITNGSRSNSWWKKYANADLHMNTLFLFSYHHEQCDPGLFYSNLEIISEKHNVVAMLLMAPSKFEEIKQLGQRIQSTLPVDVAYKPIRKQLHSTEFVSGYTDEMISFIKSLPSSNLYDRSKYQKESVNIVWPTKLYFNGVLQNWQTVLLNKQHSFKGWKCSAGSKRFSIHFNGDVTVCQQLTHDEYILGNINRRDVKLLDDYIVCPVDFCPCKDDALAEKYKED